MGAAAISGSIPGGQLVGATLAVVGLVANLIVADRAAEKAERAAEKDALAYLKGGGVAEPQAKALANVREKDHRNAGVPIRQIAERLKMDPNQLFERLQKLPPAKLDEVVKRILSSDFKKDGTLVEGPLTGRTGVQDAPVVKTDTTYRMDSDFPSEVHYAPQSLRTLAEWTKNLLAENGV